MKRLVALLLLLAACSALEPQDRARPSTFLSIETLNALPHVHTVKISPASKRPKRQIIHILDWHFIHREEFAADIQTQAEDAGESLTDADLDREWESFLREVEVVQAEQTALLNGLVKSHGLKTVFIERITDAEMADYREVAEMLRNWKEPKGDEPEDEFMRQLNREDRLLLGAASRVDGLEVRGAEDAEALAAADPFKEGRVTDFDAAANEQRENAIVRSVLASESPVVVLVMGGAHDLRDNVERIRGGEVEYVRLQVEAHRKAAGE